MRKVCQRAGVRRPLEQAVGEFIPEGADVAALGAGTHAVFEDLRAISQLSIARLQGRTMLTDLGLHDEDGLPA